MKKGGYDYPLPMIHVLFKLFSPILLILMNITFYVQYPIQCLTSVLFAKISAKSLNYIEIQMMSAIASLFDRLIAARLDLWLPISDEQSAYQKGKSTMNHIFTLRLIIEIAKKCDKPVYIGLLQRSAINQCI